MVGSFFNPLIIAEFMALLADFISIKTFRFALFNSTNTSASKTTTTTTSSNKTGCITKSISVRDINTVMSKVGMCCQLGSNERKCVTQDEFEGLFEVEEPCLEEIWEVFKVFDENKDGFIDALELGRVLCNLGFVNEGSNVERCKKMIKGFDRNNDGLLDFNDFVKFMEICLC